MSLNIGRIHCQRCLTGNSLGQELCARCGTRLMIVVEPSSLRYEEDSISIISEHDAHLLERVSALESRLARMTDKLEESFDLLLQHVSTSFSSHALLQTLVSVLSENETVDRAVLEERWRRRCAQEEEEEDEVLSSPSHLEDVRENILASYAGKRREEFIKLVDEGFDLLGEGDAQRGSRTLEHAAVIAPGNGDLIYFIGEQFFRLGKMSAARGYLERVEKWAAPDDSRLPLLLAIACGDTGEPARAASLLLEAVRRSGDSFAAHYGLGRLYAAAGDWKKALSHFRRALKARPSAEANCVVGFAYHKLNQPRKALRHLRKAARSDSSYAEAFYLLGVVHVGAGESLRATEAFKSALDLNPRETRYRAALRHIADPERIPPAALFGFGARGKRLLISGGDRRLSVALHEDALKK
ncbi:MAG: tetratricopeptide repeat protein [Pyrinomonadaceae bacterium]|nr:tetratricopeptide repeat protein [Pyrinomonadaceae bacterium]